MTAPKWYDLTLSRDKLETIAPTKEKLGEILEAQGADRYVIGEEVGEGGYRHYQVRVVYKTEHTPEWMHTIWGAYGHVSPTHVRDFKYCEKEGNFYRSWEKALRAYSDIELRPWQGQAIAILKEQNDREVACIYDPDGNHGKTWLGRYCQVNRYAQYVPPMGDAQDLMAFAMAKPARGYLFDMPRTESIKAKKGMWSAVEQIKNGYLYDKRYQFRDAWIEPPAILVMANEEPPMEALSADRWRVYTFERWGDVDTLVPY